MYQSTEALGASGACGAEETRGVSDVRGAGSTRSDADERADASACGDASAYGDADGCTDASACGEPIAASAAEAVLAEALRETGVQVIAFDESGRCVASTLVNPELEGEILDYLQSRESPLEDGARAVISRNGVRLSIVRRTIAWQKTALRIYIVRSGRDTAASHAGIRWLNAQDAREELSASAFGIIERDRSVAPAVAGAHARGAMLMLEGEPGAGKRETAELIYLEGPHARQPFVAVACDELSSKSWRYLLKSQDSPLFATGITIFFDAIQTLSEQRVRELVSTARDSSLARRCRVIFAGDDVPGGGESAQVAYVAERLACAVSIVPSVREQGGATEKVARYLDYLALTFGTEAPRIGPEAARILGDYRWPRNYLQLREVAERLYIMVGAGEVAEETAQEVLAQEEVIRSAVFAAPTLDTDLYIYRPLADTERDIARLVVDRLHGNKTRAAEVLGISRTTLWRLLK